MDTKPFGLRPVWDISRDPSAPWLMARKRVVRQSDTSTYAVGDLVFDSLNDPGVGGVPVVTVAGQQRGAAGVVVAVDPQTPDAPRAADGTYPFVPASKSKDYMLWVMAAGHREFYCRLQAGMKGSMPNMALGQRDARVLSAAPGVDGLSGSSMNFGGYDEFWVVGLAPTSDFPGNAADANGSVWIVRRRYVETNKFL